MGYFSLIAHLSNSFSSHLAFLIIKNLTPPGGLGLSLSGRVLVLNAQGPAFEHQYEKIY
jgi:hypothetical protein